MNACYRNCWVCAPGFHPGGWHPWADYCDIAAAKRAGQADPSGQRCGCHCTDEPAVDLADIEPEVVSLNATACDVCGSLTACGYDADGRPMIHATEEDDDE